MIEKIFIGNTNNLSKKIYFWTMVSGTMYSGTTYLLFLTCSWILGGYWAGIFSIVMSIGQQLITIGYFNTRTFQVSDTKEQFKFADYLVFKIITSIIMIITCVIWCFVGGFDTTKTIAVLLMTIYKIGEVMADISQGLYQKHGRYDVSGRCLFWETLVSLVAFFFGVLISRNLIIGLIAYSASYILMYIMVEPRLVAHFETVKIRIDLNKQKRLLGECLPLFVNSFLLMYINNSAKYALDIYETPEKLAEFNAIFMVAFVVNLLAGFLLKPIISVMTKHYASKEWNKLKSLILRQLLFIFGITVVCVFGAYFLGTPVLSIVSGLDLSSYRLVLCLVLFGGAFNAVYQVFQCLIIILRKQYACFIGSVIAAIATTILVFGLVSRIGVMGATVGYVVAMILMSAIYFVMAMYFIRKEKERKSEKDAL